MCKTHNGKIYLSAYYGVDIYNNKHDAELHLFTSTNGLDFEPISKRAQITTKGAEESEFEFDKDGNFWGTIRLEGSGSYVVYADKDSLHHWHSWFSKYKYDRALMFEHNDNLYVVARRHIKGPATPVEHPTKSQRQNNLIKYSFSKKYTALYLLDKTNHCLKHLMDFPRVIMLFLELHALMTTVITYSTILVTFINVKKTGLQGNWEKPLFTGQF